MPETRIIIVDDHQLFRNGLKYILKSLHNVEVIGEASNGADFLQILKSIKPDLVMMDINMPVMDGITATSKALEMHPDLNILILSMYDDYQYYQTMIDAGVKGFILKDADNEELKEAINRIMKGGNYFSQDLLLKLIKNKDNATLNLTRREKEVLRLLCEGLSTFEISEKLFISDRTVERHRANLLEKTGSKNSVSLVVHAIKNGLVDI
ncbi:MAG: response regulator [Bacteroidales bacterium]